MKLYHRLRSGTAHIARERLRILLAHERVAQSQPDLLGLLHEEILAAIRRHVAFEPDCVQIKLNCGKSVSTLAVDIEIPNGRRVPDALPKYGRPALARDGALSATNERTV
jgi:cell division topological specificity factor